MWAAKGLAILVTGSQPPLLFEVPLVLFPIGLIGLHYRLQGRGETPGRAGRAAACVALAAAPAAALIGSIASDPPEILLGLMIGAAGLGTLAGLILLGIAARRAGAFPAPWHTLPLAMGLATPVLFTIVGGLLEAINERLLEVPLVALALAWIRLGALISFPDVAAPGAEPGA